MPKFFSPQLSLVREGKRERCFEKDKVPEAFIAQGRAVLDYGVAIPYSKAIESRRGNLGLPVIKTAVIEDIQKIMKETKFENHIPKEVE